MNRATLSRSLVARNLVKLKGQKRGQCGVALI